MYPLDIPKLGPLSGIIRVALALRSGERVQFAHEGEGATFALEVDTAADGTRQILVTCTTDAGTVTLDQVPSTGEVYTEITASSDAHLAHLPALNSYDADIVLAMGHAITADMIRNSLGRKKDRMAFIDLVFIELA